MFSSSNKRENSALYLRNDLHFLCIGIRIKIITESFMVLYVLVKEGLSQHQGQSRLDIDLPNQCRAIEGTFSISCSSILNQDFDV